MYAGNFDFGAPLHLVLDHIYSPEECAELIASMEDVEWLDSTVNSAQGRVVDSSLRSNLLAFVPAPERWHELLMRRVGPKLPESLHGGDLIEIGRRLRIYRYRDGDRFGVHTDQPYSGEDEFGRTVSRLTLLLYLTEDFEGGETQFLEPEDLLIEPKVGRVLWFQHALEHAGLPVSGGEKWILRSDVFYRDQ